MEQIKSLVRERRSVRTFDGRALTPADREKLSAFIDRIENPYEIPVEFRLLDANDGGLKCPVITGTDDYVGAKVRRGPHAEEAFGYSFEMLVL